MYRKLPVVNVRGGVIKTHVTNHAIQVYKCIFCSNT